MNNEIKLVGKVSTPVQFNHNTCGETFLRFELEVMRKSGIIDKIPVKISERIYFFQKFDEGDFVEIYGDIRSYNECKPDGKKNLIIFCFAKEIKKLDDEYFKNELTIRGFICKEPVYRITSLEREITDILIAVNRQYNKSDYLPCILWGRNAKYISTFSVGTELILKGRLQSRVYKKKLEDGDIQERTVLELSINAFEVVK